VSDKPFMTQVGVLAAIAIVMTVGVYGLVAGIVKLDDLGLWLTRKANAVAQAAGRALLRAAPWLMKALSVAGTAAMFLVGGGILTHGIPAAHHFIEAQGALAGMLLNGLAGVLAGALALGVVLLVSRLRGRSA
jgi:predicted DNA repair protein MutK